MFLCIFRTYFSFENIRLWDDWFYVVTDYMHSQMCVNGRAHFGPHGIFIICYIRESSSFLWYRDKSTQYGGARCAFSRNAWCGGFINTWFQTIVVSDCYPNLGLFSIRWILMMHEIWFLTYSLTKDIFIILYKKDIPVMYTCHYEMYRNLNATSFLQFKRIMSEVCLPIRFLFSSHALMNQRNEQ